MAARSARLDTARRLLRKLEARVHAIGRALEILAGATALLVRMRTVPGVGILTATALVAFVGDIHCFPSGLRRTGVARER